MQPYAVVRQKLERQETICLDGAMGAEVVRRGVRWRDHGLRTNAAAVAELHAEYLAAGADVLRTNTFQLNRRIYQDVFRDAGHMRHIGAPGLDHRVTELVPLAVRLAQSAREGAGRAAVAIAGVMSLLKHCLRPDLPPAAELAQAEHAEIAELLANAGADLASCALRSSYHRLAVARCAYSRRMLPAPARTTSAPTSRRSVRLCRELRQHSLQTRPNQLVVLDGAIGTEILRRDLTWADHQLQKRPDVVRAVHSDYLAAGADVISTNTFQLSRRGFLQHFKDVEHMRHVGATDLERRWADLIRAGVRLA